MVFNTMKENPFSVLFEFDRKRTVPGVVHVISSFNVLKRNKVTLTSYQDSVVVGERIVEVFRSGPERKTQRVRTQ